MSSKVRGKNDSGWADSRLRSSEVSEELREEMEFF